VSSATPGSSDPAGVPAAAVPHIVFFDGVCGLCDRLVQFVLRRDRQARFRFAPLQGRLAARELPPRGARPQDLDTLYVLTADGQLLSRSRAAFFILRHLPGGWPILAALRVLPAFLTDLGYRLVARLRYRLFGRFDQCRIPSAADRDRVIDDAS
jgi:predicted DCC family thiol-disulfide oxidoreductase YuxK